MLSLSCSPLRKFPSPPPAHKPTTPASRSWHSPTLWHQSLSGPRASPPIDVQQVHPLLHMKMEPWVPPCVLFGWWFSPWELWGVLVGWYHCSSYGGARSFSEILRQIDEIRKYHFEWGNPITKEHTWYILTDKWVLGKKFEMPMIQLTDHAKLKK